MRIIAKNLGFTYNRGAKFAVTALNNVNLTIESGDFFGIIGHTGSGKSTFVEQLNALLLPDEGELFVGEFDLMKQTKKDKKKFKELRARVGMVFQYPEYQLFAETVFEDVSFGLKNFFPELTADELEARVKEAIELVGLDYSDLKDKSPFDLSGGQKRRVAIASVIVTNPDVLVLDEPAAGLDPVGKIELFKLLHRINDSGKTVIIVSHDMNDVAENCKHIAVFDGGTTVVSGTLAEVFAKPEILYKSGLDLPVTAKLQKLIAPYMSVDTNYAVDDFVEKFSLAYHKK